MADGTRVGIISGAELSAQLELKKKAERERFLAMGREETGRGSGECGRPRLAAFLIKNVGCRILLHR